MALLAWEEIQPGQTMVVRLCEDETGFLQNRGIYLLVQRAPYGFFLDTGDYRRQRAHVHPTAQACVDAAIAGEYPELLE